MEFDLDIALEFVEKVNPEPTPIEYITGQTGDALLPVILAAIMLLLVSFGAFMFFKKRKAHLNESMTSSRSTTKVATLTTSKWIALAIGAALVAAIAFFACSIVQAQAAGESWIETQKNVKAYVDKDAGTVEFDSSYLKNISDHDLIVEWSNVTQPEESAAIADLKNSNFTITGMGGTIFKGSPDPDFEYVPEDLSALKIGQTSDMNFALTDVSSEDLLKLVGQKVFVIKFHFMQNAIPVPQPNELSYNGETQTGVNEGAGYTLSGTTEAKDAGYYNATAKLISGYVWDDGTYDEKVINWKIDKRAMTITSGDAEKTYDGEKAAKEEVTEDPAFPEGEGFTYTWTSNVVNVEDTADANNTFTFEAQAGTTLNNYDVTSVYGKLTVNPREVTLTSEGHDWDYDSTAHTWEKVNVTAGSFVDGEGLEYFSFASVIDYSETPTPNTFEYDASEGTLLSNYTITTEEGNLQINKLTTPIEVTANSSEKTYDATALTDNGFTYTQGILKGTDQLFASISGEIKNVGTADNVVGEVKIMRGANDATANYTFSDHKNGTLTINKRPISLTSATETFAYNGQAHYNHDITVGGLGWASTEHATYTNFASITDYVDGGVENSFEYNEGTGTDFNNYEISVTCGTLYITKIGTPIVVTAASDSKVYDGTALTNSNYTYTDGVLVAGDRIEATIDGQAVDVDTPGTNTVTEVKVWRGTEEATSNYTFGTHITGTLTITPKDVTVKSEDHDWTYDGENHSWNVVKVTAGGFVGDEGITPVKFKEIKDFVDGGIPNTFDCTEQTGTKLSNYNLTKETGTLKINKRDITISSVGASLEYNAQEQSNPEIKVVSGEWVGDEGLDCSNFTTAIDYNGDGVDNTFSYKENAITKLTNYNLSVQYEKLQITKVASPITVTAGNANKVYDGDALTSGEYTYTQNVLKGTDALTATTSGSITNVGTATNTITDIVVKRGEAPATQNYNFERAEGTLEVTLRDIVLLSASGEWTYDGQSHSAPSADVAEGTSWAKFEGVVYSGFPSVTNYNGEGIDNEFEITAKEGTNLNNYNVTKKYGKLIVKQVSTEIVVTANSKTREYDGTPLTDAGYTYTQNVLIEGDVLTATVAADKKVLNAGDKATNNVTSVKVMRGAQDVTANYTFGTHVNGTLEVTKRNVVLQSEGFTWTYNSMTHGNQVAKVKDGCSFAPGEGVSYSNFKTIIDYTPQPVDNTFDYTPNDVTDLANYSISCEYGKLTINKIATPLVVKAASNHKTYDGEALEDNTCTYTPDILQDKDKLVATVEGSITNFGNTANKVTAVKIMRGEDDATKNYTLGDPVDGTLSIYKRNITISSKSMSWIFDGSPHSYTEVDVSGEWVGDQGVNLSGFPSVKTVDEGEVENRFTCSAKEGTDLNNYNIISKFGKIKILQVDSPIIVTANSNTKVYDGDALEDDGFTYTPQGILPEGYTIEATVTGSKTDVGKQANEVNKDSIKVYDKDHTDVTSSYTIGDPVKGLLEVTKREVTLKSEDKDWTYDGTEHSWDKINITSGSFVEGEGVEFYDHTKIIDHQNEPIKNEFSYKAKDEGTDLDNYKITREYGTLQINIIETPIVVTPATKSKVYDGTALTDSSYTFTENVLVDGDQLDVVIADSITDVGETTNSVQSYKVMRGETNATVNYNLAIPEVGKLTVTQRPITLTSDTHSWDYDASEHSSEVVNVTSELTWATGEGADYSGFPTITDYVEGGKQNTFTYAAKGTTKLSNYNISVEYGTISILKVSDPLIVTANSKTKSYDGTALTDNGFTYTDVLKGSDIVEASISGSQTEVGDGVNSVSNVKVLRGNVDVSRNYTFGEHVNGTLKVTKRAITLTSGGYTGTYDGQEHSATTVTVGGEGLVSGQVLKCTNFAKIKNYVEGGVSNTFTFALEGDISTDNYEVTYNYGTLTVNKKAVTLTSGDGSRAYNGSALTVETVTPSGFVDGEGATYSNFTSVIDVCTDTPNEFEYVLKDGTLASNYTITPAYGKLTITPYTGAIKVTASSDSKKYDGTPLTKDAYSVEGSTVGTDQLVVTIEGSITDAGTVENKVSSLKIMRGTDDATSNYSNVTKVSGILTVNPRAVTLTSGSYNAEYDGAEHTIDSLTISGDGFIEGQGLKEKSGFPPVIDVCNQTPNSFDYELNDDTKAQNYTITKVEGKLTITKVATAIVVTANSDSKTYDGNPLTNSGYTNTGETKGSDQLVVVINGTITNAGSVTNTVSSVQVTRQDGEVTKDVSTNYNLGPHVDGTLTVSKAKPTVKWEGVSTNEYKLERNNVYTDPYNFVFASQNPKISLTSDNKDSGAKITVTDTGTNPGVTVDDTKITIDPTQTTSTTFDFTFEAQTAETANYLASNVASANIKIAISSLWWGSSGESIVYLSAFETEQASKEAPSALSATARADVPWSANNFRKYATNIVVQGSSDIPKIKPKSTLQWFAAFISATEILGLEYIDTSITDNFTSTFLGTRLITNLDLSTWTVNNDANTSTMFKTCASLFTITISENWHKNLADCSLPGDAWLNSVGRGYVKAEIPIECNATYTKATKQLDVTAPDSAFADLKMTDGKAFPSAIYFNDKFHLKLITHTEEETYFDEELHDYVVEFKDYISVEVVNVEQEKTTFTYNGNLQVKENGYQFVSWDVEKTTPSEISDDYKVYKITDNDSLVVNLQAEKHATAVQYSNGNMKFYYDNVDHTMDADFLASYNVANTKVNEVTYNPSSTASKLPAWMTSSFYPFNNVTSITFDKTFKDLRMINYYKREDAGERKHIGTLFNSMSGWFMNFTNVESISGWGNVPPCVVDTRYMFYGFKNLPPLTTLDLSDFDMSSVIFANYMFGNFGNNCSDVILPSGVSSNVEEEMLKLYDTRWIDYSNMFADASTLQNITFGENFGSIECATSYSFMLKNCIGIKKLDLQNCLNLDSSSDCVTNGMLTGCIGINSFVVGFGLPDSSCEKSMTALGLPVQTYWLDEKGSNYTPDNVPYSNVWYSCQTLIHLHFGNDSKSPSGGGYGSPYNSTYDIDVFMYSAVKFDETESKIQIGYMPSGDSFIKSSEVRFYVNDPYVFKGFDGEFNKPLTENMNFTGDFRLMGDLAKTAKAVKILDSSVSANPRLIFFYDTLTEDDYASIYGDKKKAFYEVKNTFGFESGGYPAWSGDINGCEVIFDKSFKDFTAYFENGKPVQFRGMAKWFWDAYIISIDGFENIPSCVTDIQGIFFECEIENSIKCLDLSKWDMSYVWFAAGAFYTGYYIDYEKLILPDNFASKSTGEYEGYADIHHMFLWEEMVGKHCHIREVVIGKNFGGNTNDFTMLFAMMPILTSVQVGENFAPCKTSVNNFFGMFGGVESLVSVDFSGLSEGGHYDFSYLFAGNMGRPFSTLKLPNRKIFVDGAAYAFAQCTSLQSLDFSNCVFTGSQDQYECMLMCTYNLDTIIVGDSWVGVSFGDLGLTAGASDWDWYKDGQYWNVSLPVDTNSTYINKAVVKATVYIPEEYQSIASINIGAAEGLKQYSFNTPVGCDWYKSDTKNIGICWGPYYLYFELDCDSYTFEGNWVCNYAERERFIKGKNMEIYPDLTPKVTPKAVYDWQSHDLTIYNDSASHQSYYTNVYYITNNWEFTKKDVDLNITIDPSFKDCYQYWDKENQMYKEFNSCERWFEQKNINSISGLENMSSHIKNVMGMFGESTIKNDDYTFDLRGWDMSNIEDSSAMFYGFQSSYEINNIKVYFPDNFGKNANQTTCQQMFTQSCFFNVYFGQNFAPQGINFSEMFENMTQLHSLDLSTFSSTKAVNLTNLCSGCTYLSSVKLWACEVQPEQMSSAFRHCVHLNEVDMSKININDINSVKGLFDGCESLSKLVFGDLPEDTTTTITSLGYDPEVARDFGRWFAGQTEIEDFSITPLIKGVVYENIDYVNLNISSPSKVVLNSDHILNYDLNFKVLSGSHIDSDPSSKTLIFSYRGRAVLIVNVPTETDPTGLTWQHWEFLNGVNDSGEIVSDANISAYYNNGKVAKAVFYGKSPYEMMGQPTEMRFVYDNLTYTPGSGDVIDVFNIYNTSAEEGIYPPWATKDPEKCPDYYPKKVIIDSSFKDVYKCYDFVHGSGYVDFYSIDYWFAGMYNTEFVGLENLPTNIKTAQYAFMHTGPNADLEGISQYNPYCSTLDLRSFKLDNLENLFGMFKESNYSDILFSGTFGINAKNIGMLFYNSSLLTNVDLSGINTDKLDTETYDIKCYQYAVAGLEKINSFKVGINWHMPMTDVGFEKGANAWVDYRGGIYDPSYNPEPNVLYKDANWYPELLALLDSGGQTPEGQPEDPQVSDSQTPDDNPDVNQDSTDGDGDDMASAGGAAALLGAPLAFGLMFGRRRVSGKHAKLK